MCLCQKIGQNMNIKKNNKNNNGFSLVEIAVAIMFFAFAAIPIYYGITAGATQGVDTAKISIANSILASFREEVMSLPYDDDPNSALGLFTPTATWKPTGKLPKLFDALMAAQIKYKDFKFSGEVRNAPGSAVEALEFRAELTWSNPNGPDRLEKISFIKVKK